MPHACCRCPVHGQTHWYAYLTTLTQVPQLQQPKDWLRKGKPKVRSGGWHSLTAQQGGGNTAAAGVAFQSKNAALHAKPPADDSAEYPSLGGSGRSILTPATTGLQSSRQGSQRLAGPTASTDGGSGGGGRRPRAGPHSHRRAGAPPETSAAANSQGSDAAAALSHNFARVLGKSDSAKREAEAAEQQRQQLAAAELSSLHPWAGVDLVQVGMDCQVITQVLVVWMCSNRGWLT